MATRKSSKTVTVNTRKALNVSLERRVDLSQEIGFEFDVLLKELRPHIGEMRTCESHENETMAFLILDRMELVTQALIDLGSVRDDHAHSDDELSRVVLRRPARVAA